MDWPATPSFEFLEVKHPCFSEANNRLAEALYAGGDCFDALKPNLLYVRTQDKNSQYRKSRLQVAEYENHLAGMFDYSRAIAFQAPPRLIFNFNGGATAETENYYRGLNTGLRELMEGRFSDMQLHGYGLFTVSYPAVPLASQNLSQQLKPGGALDAWLAYLCPSTVEDWDCDLMGRLTRVKVHTNEYSRSVANGEVDEELHAWTYIAPTEKAVYQARRKVPLLPYLSCRTANSASLIRVPLPMPVTPRRSL